MSTPNAATDAKPRAPANTLVPDRELLLRVLNSGGDALRQCVQCATCSGVCALAAEQAPLPRKEMLWAQWGLKHRLMADVDLWLCHECNDCTRRCPRGARPGDVMAALRRECIVHYSFPRVLGRTANSPARLPWVLAACALLIGFGMWLWDSVGLAANDLAATGNRIAMSFSPRLPHSLLLTLFGSVMLFDAVVFAVGLHRFWHALAASSGLAATETRTAGASAPLGRVLRKIIWHNDFARCTEAAPRRVSHTLVLYAMVALGFVDVWIITARYNPLLGGLVYPLGLRDPWKLLANLAGIALVGGCMLMTRDRLRRRSDTARPTGTYSDWLLLALLLAVAFTGFVTEAFHFLRLDDVRFWAYLVHLVTVLTFFVLLPYSKLAHVAFRTVALIAAERSGQRQPVTALAGATKGSEVQSLQAQAAAPVAGGAP
jgi:quinone-modifying oxidoreductase subunit QmoC